MKKFRIMRYLFIAFGLLFFQFSIIKSQNWQWAKHFSGPGDIKPVDVVTDNSNNIYIVGTYSDGTVDIGFDQLASYGKKDIFICSFNALGNYRWAVRIGGSENDVIGSIVVDKDNNIYVVGEYKSNPVNFNTTQLTNDETKFNAFLAKYDTDGNLIYAKKIFWGTDNEILNDISLDESNSELIIVGTIKKQIIYFNGTQNDTVNVVDNTVKENFISVFDLSGNYKNFKHFVGSMGRTEFKNVDITGVGGYFITGDLQDSLYLSGTDTIAGDDTNTDILVMRVDNNLDYIWARKGGGTGYDHINSSASDNYGNIYFTGKVEGTITFDSTATLQSNSIDGFGAQDMYIGKYNRDGNLQWVTRNGSIGDDDGYGLAVSDDWVQFAGNYSDTVVFNNDTLASSSVYDVNTGFAIYDHNGVAIGAQELTGDGEEEDRGKGVVFDLTGNTYVIGFFTSSTFTAGTFNLNNSSGTSDGFLVKYAYPFSIAETKHQNVSCNGGSDGEIIVTPHFGTPPFTYDWTPSVSTDSTASNLSVGTYKVVVTDGFSSKDSLTIDITEPTEISISEVITDVQCHPDNGSGNDGAIDITVSGGTPAYAFNWTTDGGSGVSATAEDQTGLTAGTYYVTVTDDNSCEAKDTFIVAQPDSISFSGTVVTEIKRPLPPDVGNYGDVDLTVNGGTIPYQSYAWAGPGSYTSTDEDIDSLTLGGTYSVVVTDDNGCTEDTSLFVNDSTLFLVFFKPEDIVNVDCRGNSTGSATVSHSGGTGPYTYEWTDALAQPVGGDNPTLSNVPAGTYYCKVTDNFDMDDQAVVTISEPSEDLTAILLDKVEPDCNGDDDGSIDIGISGGTLPYSYAWLPNGETSEDISNLGPGTYSVTVTDDHGCTAQVSNIEITEPSTIVPDPQILDEILCNGDNTGRIDGNAKGGTGVLSYLWNDPAAQSNKIATNLFAGNYQVTVTDENGCQKTSSQVSLSEPSEIQISEIHKDLTCYGDNDGFIILTVTGGTVPYTYLWEPILAITKDITDLDAGEYIVTVTDANNCTKKDTTIISEPAAISIDSVKVTNLACYGDTDGSIDITVSGGTGPYTYSWDHGPTTEDVSGLSAGDYTITVQDVNSCTQDSTITITEPAGMEVNHVETDVTCNGGNNGAIVITVTGGAGGYTYTWSHGPTTEDVTGLAAADYTVTVEDANACTLDSTFTITEPDAITIDSEENTDISCYGEDDGTITITASGGTGVLTYTLNPGAIQTNSTGAFTGLSSGTFTVDVDDANGCGPVTSGNIIIIEPDSLYIDTLLLNTDGSITITAMGGIKPYEYSIDGGTTFLSDSVFSDISTVQITVVVKDANGCTVTRQFTVIIEIEIYDAFTPNADGINDLWNIHGLNIMYPNCIVKVYSTWGTLVFSSNGYPEPWDGTRNGTELPAGTYIYVIDLGDGSDPMTGTVNIIK